MMVKSQFTRIFPCRLDIVVYIFFIICNLYIGISPLYCQESRGPIVVNGDSVEYGTNNKEVTATGNVLVIYKGARLTCRKLTVNTETKDAQAEGDVRLEDEKGIIEGEKLTYNFQTKTGNVINADFKSNPYFGKAASIEKVSESEFIAHDGYATTCSFDHPHYRMKTKTMDFVQGEKMQVKGAGFYLKDTPIFRLPEYTHRLKDSTMRLTFLPGSRKAWGPFVLTSYRYDLSDNVKGKLYMDYRSNLGPAEGFSTNYNTLHFGSGDFKYYYAHEHDRKQPEGEPSQFQRYLVRLRHKWDIDSRTNFTSEYYKIVDSKRILLGPDHYILKDYFPREFERDTQPPTYALFHHSFAYSTFDALVQKRINRWYDADKQLEKLPQVTYSLPSLQLWSTPFYLEHHTAFANFAQQHQAPSSGDFDVARFDAYNKLLLPAKIAFVELSPFVASRQTYYNQDVDGSTVVPRTVFYTGAGASTKFYRIYNVNTGFLGMAIDGLRHIITPSVAYTYNHEPTVSSSRLLQLNPIDPIDSIDVNNSVALGLSNKLQTKRNGQTVNLLDWRVTTNYSFYARDPQTHDKSGAGLSDFLTRLTLIPYAWIRLDVDATYATKQDCFTQVNPGITFDFGKERSLSFAHRYERKGGKEMTFYGNWRVSPKWKFGIYERYQFAHIANTRTGLAEQQYTFSRDLHCWEMDFTYNIEKNHGHTILFVFRVKSFPELGFNFNQSYSPPRSGSQANQ